MATTGRSIGILPRCDLDFTIMMLSMMRIFFIFFYLLTMRMVTKTCSIRLSISPKER